MREGIPRGNADALRGLLLQLKGSDQEPGRFYYPEGNKWLQCTLENLREKEKQLQKQWKSHVQSRVDIGERPPKEWPRYLAEPRDRLEAQKLVAEEEIKVLEGLLEKAEAEKHQREKRRVRPRFWGAGNLSGGTLVEFCGWDVRKNDEGILAVDDPSSPYDTMEIWRLKSQVLNPLFHEYRLRQRLETKAALEENRPRKNVPFPVPPSYDMESDQIEYQGYSNATIRKVKQDA